MTPFSFTIASSYGQDERYVLPSEVSSDIRLINCPDDSCHEQQYIDYLSGIERTSEHIDKKKFEPSANSHNARDNAVKHSRNDDKRDDERDKRAFEFDVRETAIAVNQHNGGYAEQIEKVHTDGETCHVCYEHKPAVAVRSSAWSSHLSISQNTTAVKAEE